MKILRCIFKDSLSAFDVLIIFLIMSLSFADQFNLMIFTVIFGAVISGKVLF